MNVKKAILLLLFSVESLLASGFDVEYWQKFNATTYKTEDFKLYTVAELRWNREVSHFYYVKLAECLAYEMLPWVDLEMHYCYLYHKPRGSLQFTHVNRLEFECNPTFRINDKLSYKIRNRLELIKRQNTTGLQSVYRFRGLFAYDYAGEKLLSISCSNETFFDLNRGLFTQNRCIPLELTFKLSPRLTCSTSLMIRNFYTSNRWYRSLVLGTELFF